jgi:hypothetical protein
MHEYIERMVAGSSPTQNKSGRLTRRAKSVDLSLRVDGSAKSVDLSLRVDGSAKSVDLSLRVDGSANTCKHRHVRESLTEIVQGFGSVSLIEEWHSSTEREKDVGMRCEFALSRYMTIQLNDAVMGLRATNFPTVSSIHKSLSVIRRRCWQIASASVSKFFLLFQVVDVDTFVLRSKDRGDRVVWKIARVRGSVV